MKIIKTKGDSLSTGDISRACSLCISGRKSVLFITGKCNKSCYYCPISEKRKGKTSMWINEKQVKEDSDIIEEINTCGSGGVGITGGEPLLDIENTILYITLLKKTFGKNFNIHLYTCRDDLNKTELKRLHDSGLDEIRFHSFSINHTIKKAREFNWTLTIEIPVIPEEIKQVTELIKESDKLKVDFINLNELEFSDTNSDNMQKKGFTLTDDNLYTVKGSYETAKYVLDSIKQPLKHTVLHFCTSSNKYDYQYWNRLKNRAKNIKKDFEIVQKNGLIKKGVIFAKEGESLEQTVQKLKLKLKNFSIEKKDIGLRIETTTQNARFGARKGYQCAEVLEIPSAEPFDLEVTFFNKKGKLME